jgi:hypothetical protein
MRISRSTGAFSGLLLVVLGLWGGLVPFIGPYFHYSFGSTATWHFTTNRLWLDVLPGLTVVLGGLGLMRAGHRVSGSTAAWLAIAGGAWFAVGPAVSLLWEHSSGPIGAPLYGSTRRMLELVGYFYGLGALIVALAAFALGRFVTKPALVSEPAVEEPAAVTTPASAAAVPVASTEPAPASAPVAAAQPVPVPEPVLATQPVATPEPVVDATAPVRRRSLIGRRRAAGREREYDAAGSRDPDA